MNNNINGFCNGIESYCNCGNFNPYKPSRLRGVLWITAAAVAVVGGAVLAAIGGGLVYIGASMEKTVIGMPVGPLIIGVGLSTVLAAMPFGLKLASKFVTKGWADLTHRKMTHLEG